IGQFRVSRFHRRDTETQRINLSVCSEKEPPLIIAKIKRKCQVKYLCPFATIASSLCLLLRGGPGWCHSSRRRLPGLWLPSAAGTWKAVRDGGWCESA